MCNLCVCFSLGHKPSKMDNSRLGIFSCGAENRNSIASIPDTITATVGPLVRLFVCVCGEVGWNVFVLFFYY